MNTLFIWLYIYKIGLYNEGQPSTIQGFNLANKWRASQAIDFFHGIPNKSQGSHLGYQLLGGPRILHDKVYCQEGPNRSWLIKFIANQYCIKNSK